MTYGHIERVHSKHGEPVFGGGDHDARRPIGSPGAVLDHEPRRRFR
jgi:hypothetical protein